MKPIDYINNNVYAFNPEFNLKEVGFKHINIVYRIMRVYELCEEYTDEWKKRKDIGGSFHYKLSFLQEEIIFHVRRAVDDMISCSYVEMMLKTKKQLVKVDIDSIGAYLDENNTILNCFDEKKEFLLKLNDIANSFKHSYHQTEFMNILRKEPTFRVVHTKYNDMRKEPEYYNVKPSYIIQGLNEMFEIFDNYIK